MPKLRQKQAKTVEPRRHDKGCRFVLSMAGNQPRRARKPFLVKE